jgi:hypothetical protein
LRTISQQELNWRRDRVRELTIKGHTQREIASELRIDVAMINRDLKYLREQARQNIQHYIDEHLPIEWENTIQSLNLIIKEEWDSNPKEDRNRIMSRSLIKECLAMRIELMSSSQVIDRAIKFVDRHRQDRGSMTQNKELVIDGATQ